MTQPNSVQLPGGRTLPALGLGTWHMGEKKADRAREVAALKAGIDLGLTVIDTAEMYGNGGAEEVVAEAIAGARDKVYLVSKVQPPQALLTGVDRAFARRVIRQNLAHEIDLVTHTRDGFRDYFFSAAVSIHLGAIDDGQPQIDSSFQCRDFSRAIGFFLRPPARLSFSINHQQRSKT